MTTTSLKEHFARKAGRNAKLLEPFNIFFQEIFRAKENTIRPHKAYRQFVSHLTRCVTKFIKI